MERGQIEETIDRLFDGLASPEEQQALIALLEANEAARAEYVRGCLTRASLADYFTGDPVETGPAPSTSGRRQEGYRRAAGILAALAACLAFFALGRGFFPQPGPAAPAVALPDEQPRPPAPGSPQGGGDAGQQVIGRIARKIDCVWNAEAWSVGSTADVLAGQTISLERGFMSIEFENGVTVLLDGPAEFTAVDQLHGLLEYGGGSVRVPKGFSGYVMLTPSAVVTDLGTEFSVLVDTGGATDLHVIEGEVTVSRRDARGRVSKAEPQLLTASSSVWSSVSSLRAPDGPPSPEDFPTVSMLEDPAFEFVSGMPVVEDLALWLRADTAVAVDGEDRVIAWGDVSSIAPEERHSAWQVVEQSRPRLNPNGVAGRPSIRFDGIDDCLITEPFATTNAQTVVIVARLNSLRSKNNSDPPTQQFLNYNGPPQLELEYRWPAKQLRAKAFAGYNPTLKRSGWIVARRISQGETLAMLYSYDHAANESYFYLNGEQQGVARALVPIAGSRPKVIGAHRQLRGGTIDGEIAELAIFNRAVSYEEVVAINAYLQERYGLDLADGR